MAQILIAPCEDKDPDVLPTISPIVEGADSPAANHFLIVPDDNADLSVKPRFLIIGVTGDLEVVMNGVTIVYQNVSGVLPIRPDRIKALNTTALNIIGEY